MGEIKKHGRDIPIEFSQEKSTEEKSQGLEHEIELDQEVPVTKTARGKDDHKKKIEEYKKKNEDLHDQLLRLKAEFSNYKKRMDRDQIEFADYLKGEFIKKFLPVIDDFDHMIKKSEADNNSDPLLEGVRLIYNKFLQIFKDYGVEKIDAMGKEFNPQIHEAMMMRKIDRLDQNGKVIDIFQQGYVIKEKLLRPSKVIVGQYEDGEHKN